MYEKILARYRDELGDVVTYCDLAKEAESDTQKCILYDIAREEHQHATMLKHILEKGEKYSPDDALKEMEREAKMAIASF